MHQDLVVARRVIRKLARAYEGNVEASRAGNPCDACVVGGDDRPVDVLNLREHGDHVGEQGPSHERVDVLQRDAFAPAPCGNNCQHSALAIHVENRLELRDGSLDFGQVGA
jgi:hypothetical protein